MSRVDAPTAARCALGSLPPARASFPDRDRDHPRRRFPTHVSPSCSSPPLPRLPRALARVHLAPRARPLIASMRELLRRASHAAEHAPQQHADAHRFVANPRLIFTPRARSRVLFHRFPRVPRRKNTRSQPIARSRKFRRARDRGRRREAIFAKKSDEFAPWRWMDRLKALDRRRFRTAMFRSTARRGSKRERSRAIASSIARGAVANPRSASAVVEHAARCGDDSGRVRGFACFCTMF